MVRRRRLLSLFGALSLALGGAAEADIEVCPTCPVSSVSSAIRGAQPGERIRVLAGTYREGNIVVDRPVKLEGVGWPVLDGELKTEVLTIKASGVEVSGFRVVRSAQSVLGDPAGIKLMGVTGCTVHDNRLEDNLFSIYLAKSNDCLVQNNQIASHAKSEVLSGNGVHIWDCGGIRILGNRITGHRDGIYLEFLRGGTVEGNTSEGNLRYGMHFMFSRSSRYAGNTFRRNGAGVAVMYSKNIVMTGNLFEDNWGAAAFGLLLKDIDDSSITHNVFRRDTLGVFVDGSNRVDVRENDFLQNGWAVRLFASSTGILFNRNNFIGNSFDVTTNSHHSFNSFQQNFWSQYQGYDLDRNGIGDAPFRPVSLFSLLTETYPQVVLLLRSPLVAVLEYSERLFPVLVPPTLADPFPLMRRWQWSRQ
jgi:nitrous oxidase accessory protein